MMRIVCNCMLLMFFFILTGCIGNKMTNPRKINAELHDSDIIRDRVCLRYPKNLRGVIHKRGRVPDQMIAARIAEAIWYSYYKDTIFLCRPYHVALIGDIMWVVKPTTYGNVGYGYVEINRQDGRIIRVIWGK